MSIISSTPAQILNSPLNNSPSKMQYSFSKAKRLPDVKTSMCPQAFYDLPPVASKRTTTLGYGTKFDFTKNGKAVPPPNTYTLKDEFSDGKKKGKSFGLSREFVKAQGFQLGDKNSPGPGAYDVREINKTKISFSFRPRTNLNATVSSIKSPGPGTYPSPTAISNTGKYFYSKFKNSGAITFAPPRSTRFPATKDGNQPGPGAYQTSIGFSPKGSYFVSNFKSSMGRTFGSSSRKNLSSTNTTPGPGSYRLPSDFGYYESAKAKSSSTSQMKKSEPQAQDS